MPVGAYGGRRDVMSVVSPLGSVYQAGTLSGNPIAMRAGITQLRILQEHPELYIQLNELGQYFRSGMQRIIDKKQLACQVTGIGSLSCLYFTARNVTDYESAKTADTTEFASYFNQMLDRGNYFGASQFEAIFLSASHRKADIDKTLSDMEDVLGV